MSNNPIESLFQETLSEEFREELKAVIRTVVREELKSSPHLCRFDVTDKDAASLGVFSTMVKSIGDGDLEKGMFIVIEDLRYIGKQIKQSEKVRTAITYIALTSIVGGIMTSIWFGLKALIGRH